MTSESKHLRCYPSGGFQVFPIGYRVIARWVSSVSHRRVKER